MNAARRVARWLLQLGLPARDREFIIGDLDEEYALRLERNGGFAAARWYWRQTIATLASETRYALSDEPTVVPGQPKRGSMFDMLRQDLRYAWRSLNARPLFTSVAVITLALGTGANTGIFSIANWLLLRPVPGIGAQHELAEFEFTAPGRPMGISWQNLNDIQKSVRSFSGMTGWASTPLQVLIPGAPSITLSADAVAGDYFGLLKAGTRLGRPILPDETVPGKPAHVAVISEQLWRTMFASDEQVIGRRMRANKVELTIVGVAANGLRGIQRSSATDVWVPYSLYGELRHMDPKGYEIRGTGMRMFKTVGRLKPGVTAEQAQADLQRALDGVIAQFPNDNEIYKEHPARLYGGIGVEPLARERTRELVNLLLVIVGLLLLISSANVANMLLVRGVQRRGEAAIRRACGASGSRLAAQMFVESIVLALAGGIAGIIVAGAFLKLIEGSQLMRWQTIDNVPLDWRVLVFAIGTSLLTGIVFGFAPLRGIRKLDLSAELHGSSGRLTRRSGLRQVIVVGQIALSLMLVVGALLLGKTLRAYAAVELGFNPKGLAATNVVTEPQGYKPEASAQLAERLLDRTRSSPAVQAAALASYMPFGGVRSSYWVEPPAGGAAARFQMQVLHVSDGFFQTVQTPIMRGRALESADWIGARKDEINIVLSEAAAKRLFGTTDPVGRLLMSKSFRDTMTLNVVGVVADARLQNLREPAPEMMYWPLHSLDRGFGFALIARSAAAAAILEPELQRALASVDPAIPLQFKSVETNLREYLGEQRLLAKLLMMFSGLAVLLSAIGLYGVLGTSVNERRREIGIRLALGADAKRVLSIIVGESARIIVVGVVVGLVSAVWLSKLLQSQLFGVNRFAGSVYLIAAVLFGIAATIATAIPVRAAARVEPSVALRQE